MSFSAGEKHVACVIAASAAGRLAPPFLVVAGKNAMSGWVEPIGHDLSSCDPAVRMLSERDWLDGDAAICTSPKGSMEMSLIHPVIDYVQKFFRKFVPPTEPLLALLDGHTSRSGLRWLMKAEKNLIEVAKIPSDASHFLQPCDDTINESFQRSVGKIRDSLVAACRGIGAGTPQFKLARASCALRSMTANDIIKSFQSTGMWPMNCRFLDRFRTPRQQVINEACEESQQSPVA